jgi:hypothetical protein
MITPEDAYPPSVVLIVPRSRSGNNGRVRLTLPANVARWLHDELATALDLGGPRLKQRRPVRLKGGKWQGRARR